MNQGNIERIAELPITEWIGAKIFVRIEWPNLKNSISTQMYIDKKQLNDLRHLNPPKDLELILDKNPDKGRFLFVRWDQQKTKALALINLLSQNISWQLSNAIAEELKNDESVI